MQSSSRKRLTGFFISMAGAISLFYGAPLLAQSPAAERGMWMANMGQAGLRRSYSSGSDLGEMVNRAVAYQMSNRLYEQGRAENPDLRRRDINSRVDSYVAQNDSLIPLEISGLDRPLFLRALGRVAWRDEEDAVKSRNDRIDLGLLYAPSRYSFVSLGLAGENTDSDLRFVNGSSDGRAWGPRLDAGVVYNDTWSFATRYDYFTYSGESLVTVPTGDTFLDIDRDVKLRREYVNLEAIARYDRRQLDWLPEGSQLRWHSALQYLALGYSPRENSLGQTPEEPFGNSQRLGIIRTGLNFSSTFGENDNWNASGELMIDHEFDTNMNHPINDSITGSWSIGLTRLFQPGQRMMVEYQRYENRRGQRSRNNFSLIAVFDF